MSFISNMFGASSGFTPGGGNAQQQKYITSANANYDQANTGLNQLAQMLQAQASGQGPNLANQNLQNFTGQNVANQAALMAGQRGASTNPALIARQIAQQGAGIQQQAAGQAASNVLAQQLAAQQQLGGVYGTQGGLANQNYGITQGAVTGNNQIGAQTAGQNAKTNSGILGGVANAVGGMTGLFAQGGEVEKIHPLKAKLPSMKTHIPEHLHHIASIRYPHLAHGGEVPIMVSPGERILKPEAAEKVAHGKADPIKASQPVPGKAKYRGDNYSNDTVPKEAPAGSIVLPKHITEHKDAPKLAYDFVSRIKAGHHKPKAKK